MQISQQRCMKNEKRGRQTTQWRYRWMPGVCDITRRDTPYWQDPDTEASFFFGVLHQGLPPSTQNQEDRRKTLIVPDDKPPHISLRHGLACACLRRTTAQQVQIKMKTGLSDVRGADGGRRRRRKGGSAVTCLEYQSAEETKPFQEV